MARFLFAFGICVWPMVGMSEASMLAIQLDDAAGNTVTVMDNGVGDLDSTVGVVVYSGSLGGTTVWTVNVTTGIGAPVIGSTSFPQLHLNSVNVSSSGGGTLNLAVSQTDFLQASAPLPYTFAVGGVSNGTFQTSAFANSNNLLFSTTGAGATQIGPTVGPLGGAFSSTTSGTPGSSAGAGLYSLTINATITHSAGGTVTSFDAQLQAIPEPASVAAWLILGAMGLVFAGLKKRRRH